jgi:hypothetical protein
MERDTPEFFEQYQQLSQEFEELERLLLQVGELLKTDTKVDIDYLIDLVTEWADARNALYNHLRSGEAIELYEQMRSGEEEPTENP